MVSPVCVHLAVLGVVSAAVWIVNLSLVCHPFMYSYYIYFTSLLLGSILSLHTHCAALVVHHSDSRSFSGLVDLFLAGSLNKTVA